MGSLCLRFIESYNSRRTIISRRPAEPRHPFSSLSSSSSSSSDYNTRRRMNTSFYADRYTRPRTLAFINSSDGSRAPLFSAMILKYFDFYPLSSGLHPRDIPFEFYLLKTCPPFRFFRLAHRRSYALIQCSEVSHPKRLNTDTKNIASNIKQRWGDWPILATCTY